MVLAVVVVLASPSAWAWNRSCAWASGTIPVYVLADTTTNFGFTFEQMFWLVEQMGRPWNTTGGVNVRLAYPTYVSGTTPGTSGGINYRMFGSRPGTLAVMNGNCVTSYVDFYNKIYLSASRPLTSGSDNIISIGVHETGHALGFLHPLDSPGTCGKGGDTSASAVTVMTQSDGWGHAHNIWLDDWQGLRSGTCPYTASTPSGATRVYSTTNTTTWTHVVSWGTGTNLTPGIAWGAPSGGTGFTVQASVNFNNSLSVWKYQSGWVSGYTSPDNAMAGPVVAYGNGRFIVAYPKQTSGSEGFLRVMHSTDGVNWTSYFPSIRTAHRVGLAYSTNTNRWYLSYVRLRDNVGGFNNPNGRVQIVSSSDGINWSSESDFGEEYAVDGIGLTCDGSYCYTLYSSARTGVGTLRESVFYFDGSGNPLLDHSYSFPLWNGMQTTSRYDVSAAYDASRGQIVYVSKNYNAIRAMWRLAGSSDPPPGFVGWPETPGFPSGSTVAGSNNTTEGGAVTFVGGGANEVWLMAHLP
ncbi:MAG: hypothetical protein EPO40_09310 [Myxococcaceae bacterium]|nr:MAG: hypothetical protein EPO40_09310 [Myxococcaceae bacterium]